MEACKKCGSTKIKMTRDSRGIPEAHCADCGYFIKKMSTADVIAYYESEFAPIDKGVEVEVEVDKPMCRYCTEPIYKRVNRISYAELTDSQYCPMCGRKKKATDKNY